MADTVQASELEEEQQENENEDDGGTDEDGDGSGDSDEVFIVEDILDHRADFLDGKVRYQVKWKGYDEESESTWEPEESFVGARAILEGYWGKVGGKPTPQTTAKKRGRQPGQINGGAAEKQSGEADASAKSRKLAASANDDDSSSPDPDDYTDILGPDEWTPPRASHESWENSVQSVETVEADDDGVLWVFLSWNEKDEEGRFIRNKVKASTCYKACPLKMLRFFESHLVLPSDKVT